MTVRLPTYFLASVKILALYKVESGLKCIKNGRERDGRIKFREAIKLDKKCASAYLYLSDSYIRENRYDDALTELKKFFIMRGFLGRLKIFLNRFFKTAPRMNPFVFRWLIFMNEKVN